MATQKVILIFILLISNQVFSKALFFDVFMDEDAVGTHLYEFDNDKVVSKANYRIKVLFMNFTYKHESIESYENGSLISINSITNDDGDNYRLSGEGSVDEMNILVNDKKINIPSYQVNPGDNISLSDKAQSQSRVQQSLEIAKNREECDWVEVNEGIFSGVYLSLIHI